MVGGLLGEIPIFLDPLNGVGYRPGINFRCTVRYPTNIDGNWFQTLEPGNDRRKKDD